MSPRFWYGISKRGRGAEKVMRSIRIKPTAIIFFLTCVFCPHRLRDTGFPHEKEGSADVEKGLLRAVYIKGIEDRQNASHRADGVLQGPWREHRRHRQVPGRVGKSLWLSGHLELPALNDGIPVPGGGLSRPLTAAAVLGLAAKGRIDMDGDIASFLPFLENPPSCAGVPRT